MPKYRIVYGLMKIQTAQKRLPVNSNSGNIALSRTSRAPSNMFVSKRIAKKLFGNSLHMNESMSHS